MQDRLVHNHLNLLVKQGDDREAQAKANEIAFVKLYLISLRGLNLTQGSAERERDSTEQSRFRHELIDVSCATHPIETRDALWCHIANRWVNTNYIKAAHVFSYKHGKDIMNAIFGKEPGVESELFSPLNGLIMSDLAEAKFDQGFLVVVPDLEEGASAAKIQDGHACSEKGYKIRVVNKEGKAMKTSIDVTDEKTWNDLDNQVIQFRSSFRPRSRYLYFHYLTCMLRRAWTTEKQGDALKDRLGNRYWATPGPYLRGMFLKGFVNEVGHVFEEVVQGGAIEGVVVEQAEEEADLTAVWVAAQQIMLSHEGQEEIGDSDDDDDDDDEESFQGFGP